MTAAARAYQREQLCEKVADFLRRADDGTDDRGDDDRGERELDRLALEVFAFQFAAIAPYQRLCRGVGRTPETVSSWRGIPAVPALAFKQYALFADAPDAIVRTFRSSGTSEPGRSSQAHFSRAGLELMDTAVAVAARARLFPEGRSTRILVLAPPPAQVPHMIMVHGMAHLIGVYGLDGSRFVAGPGGLDFAALWTELDGCQHAGVPVSLLGSSFGFVHFFDWMEAAGRRLELPAGSRVMDAGGYKGRSREIGRDTFVRWAAQLCGVPPGHVVNLLGMTELASQIYDQLPPGAAARTAWRRKVPPPWVRTAVVDPRRIGPDGPEPVEDGELGLLRHLDLANVERPIMIQSEDVGRVVPADGAWRRGFEIVGRAKGAEPRGCSLSVEDLAAPARHVQRVSA
jgi:Acyl-protein synthetase, LuxE